MIEILHNNGVTAYNEPGAFILPSHLPIYKAILGAKSTPMYSFLYLDPKDLSFNIKKKEMKPLLKLLKKLQKYFLILERYDFLKIK